MPVPPPRVHGTHQVVRESRQPFGRRCSSHVPMEPANYSTGAAPGPWTRPGHCQRGPGRSHVTRTAEQRTPHPVVGRRARAELPRPRARRSAASPGVSQAPTQGRLGPECLQLIKCDDASPNTAPLLGAGLQEVTHGLVGLVPRHKQSVAVHPGSRLYYNHDRFSAMGIGRKRGEIELDTGVTIRCGKHKLARHTAHDSAASTNSFECDCDVRVLCQSKELPRHVNIEVHLTPSTTGSGHLCHKSHLCTGQECRYGPLGHSAIRSPGTFMRSS